MSLVILSIKHPFPLLQERTELFSSSIGIIPKKQKSIVDDTFKFDEDDKRINAQNILLHNVGGYFVNPVNKEIRKSVIFFLSGRNSKGDVTCFSYFFTALDGILAIFLLWFVSLLRKNIELFTINSTFILQELIVFFTAPDPNFYYYLPFKICGRVELFVLIAYFALKFDKKKIVL